MNIKSYLTTLCAHALDRISKFQCCIHRCSID